MMHELRLYYQRAENNFGDMLSPMIVAAISGRSCIWSKPQQADLVAVGSLMERVIRKRWQRPFFGCFRPLAVWGTGFIAPGETVNSALLSCLALRGRISRDRLAGARGACALGDPALLVRELFPQKTAPKDHGVLLAPHMADRGAWVEAAIQNDGLKTKRLPLNIDVPDILEAIANAELVATSAMHPLIVAIAFGRPAIWVDPATTEIEGGTYKFYDFFSAFDMRPAPHSRDPEEWASARLATLMKSANTYEPANGVLERIADGLRQSLTI